MRKLFGRSRECDIYLKDAPESVSRKHGVLIEEDGCIFLRDTSSNGTYVNGHKIHNQKVSLDADTKIWLTKNYQFIWQKYVDMSVLEDKETIMGSMGSFVDDSIDDFIDDSLDDYGNHNNHRNSPLVEIPAAIEINRNDANVYRNGESGADWKVPLKRNMGERIGNSVGTTLGCIFSLAIIAAVIAIIAAFAS